MPRVHLIDITPELQSPVTWSKVSEAGFRGVYIKRSQYSATRTNRSEVYARAARDAGLAVGYYHFAYVGSDPVKQAQFFFRLSREDNNDIPIGSQPGDLPPVLDLEFVKDFNAPGCSPKEVVQWGIAFMEEATRLWYPDNRLLKPDDYRYRLPIVYTYKYFGTSLQPWLGQSSLVNYPLWIASPKAKWDPIKKQSIYLPYIPEEDDSPVYIPGAWKQWTLWQYSGNNGYKVPGIAQDCDRNVFNGMYDEWNRFLSIPPKCVSHGTLGDAAVDEVQKK